KVREVRLLDVNGVLLAGGPGLAPAECRKDLGDSLRLLPAAQLVHLGEVARNLCLRAASRLHGRLAYLCRCRHGWEDERPAGQGARAVSLFVTQRTPAIAIPAVPKGSHPATTASAFARHALAVPAYLPRAARVLAGSARRAAAGRPRVPSRRPRARF